LNLFLIGKKKPNLRVWDLFSFCSSSSSVFSSLSLISLHSDEGEEEDEEILKLPLQAKEQEEKGEGEVVMWEFQVLFGVGYQVPVIYFNASRRNGSPLEWSEVIKELVSRQRKKEEEEGSQSYTAREQQHQTRLQKIITQKVY
jgi:hypothetical protein